MTFIALCVFPQRVASVAMHFIHNYEYLIPYIDVKIEAFGFLSWKDVQIDLSDFVLEEWDILF